MDISMPVVAMALPTGSGCCIIYYQTASTQQCTGCRFTRRDIENENADVQLVEWQEELGLLSTDNAVVSHQTGKVGSRCIYLNMDEGPGTL